MGFLIPAILGAVSMISQNANNKAAIKNNETQQASAVGNSKQAAIDAQNQLKTWNAGHPAPTYNVGAPPQAGAYGPGGPHQGATQLAPGGNPGGNNAAPPQAPAPPAPQLAGNPQHGGPTGYPPAVQALIDQIMNSMGGAGGGGGSGATRQPL